MKKLVLIGILFALLIALSAAHATDFCNLSVEDTLSDNLNCPDGMNITASGIIHTADYNVTVNGNVDIYGTFDVTAASTLNVTGTANISGLLSAQSMEMVKHSWDRWGTYQIFGSMIINPGGRYYGTDAATYITDYMAINGTYTPNYGSIVIDGVNMTIPSGTENLTIEKITDPASPPSGKQLVKSIKITKYDSNGGFKGKRVNITYNDESVYREESLQLWKHTGSGWTQDGIAETGVDTANNIVWANITSFSDFGVLGDAPPSPAPEFSDIAYVLAAVLGAGGFVLIRSKLFK